MQNVADMHALYTCALRAKNRPGISRHLSVARLRAICSLVKDPDLQEHGQNMVPPPLADLLPPWDSNDDIRLHLGEHQLDPSAKMDDAIVVLDSEDEKGENENQ